MQYLLYMLPRVVGTRASRITRLVHWGSALKQPTGFIFSSIPRILPLGFCAGLWLQFVEYAHTLKREFCTVHKISCNFITLDLGSNIAQSMRSIITMMRKIIFLLLFYTEKNGCLELISICLTME